MIPVATLEGAEKSYGLELRRRAAIYAAAERDPSLQALLRERCRRDPVFWLRNFGWVEEPRLTPAVRPFIPWDHQIETIRLFLGLDARAWTAGQVPPHRTPVAGEGRRNVLWPVAEEKSRDMGESWATMAGCVWGWQFWQDQYGVLSEAREEVDDFTAGSLFGKARVLIYGQPAWLRPKPFRQGPATARFLRADNALRLRHGVGVIKGATGKNPHRGRRYRRILVDEAAHLEDLERAMEALDMATPAPWLLSSVKGRNGFWRRARGPLSKGYLLVERDWRLHPEHDEAWYEVQKGRMRPEAVAQELDRDYDRSVVGRIFKDFLPARHVLSDQRAVDLERSLPGLLYEAWDFGSGANASTAVVWAYYDRAADQLLFWESIDEVEKPFDWWGKTVGQAGYRSSTNREGRLPNTRLGDPAGRQRDSAQTSWFSNLRDKCEVNLIPAEVSPFKRIDALAFAIRRGQVMVHPRAERLIKALQEYRWDVPRNVDAEDWVERKKVEPRKDWSSHLCDAATEIAFEVWGTGQAAEFAQNVINPHRVPYLAADLLPQASLLEGWEITPERQAVVWGYVDRVGDYLYLWDAIDAAGKSPEWFAGQAQARGYAALAGQGRKPDERVVDLQAITAGAREWRTILRDKCSIELRHQAKPAARRDEVLSFYLRAGKVLVHPERENLIAALRDHRVRPTPETTALWNAASRVAVLVWP